MQTTFSAKSKQSRFFFWLFLLLLKNHETVQLYLFFQFQV